MIRHLYTSFILVALVALQSGCKTESEVPRLGSRVVPLSAGTHRESLTASDWRKNAKSIQPRLHDASYLINLSETSGAYMSSRGIRSIFKDNDSFAQALTQRAKQELASKNLSSSPAELLNLDLGPVQILHLAQVESHRDKTAHAESPIPSEPRSHPFGNLSPGTMAKIQFKIHDKSNKVLIEGCAEGWVSNDDPLPVNNSGKDYIACLRAIAGIGDLMDSK